MQISCTRWIKKLANANTPTCTLVQTMDLTQPYQTSFKDPLHGYLRLSATATLAPTWMMTFLQVQSPLRMRNCWKNSTGLNMRYKSRNHAVHCKKVLVNMRMKSQMFSQGISLTGMNWRRSTKVLHLQD